ncbi:MAG: hypothetical protein II008_14160 [Oscillospiraceae bacterium]|nr:hypothetical protein [Oscillospiraceae bacterium]
MAEKIETVTVLVDNDPEATPEVVRVYLLQAQQKILDRLYPLNREKYAGGVPEEYDYLHCELTARRFLRRGAESELNHEENGINRSFGSVNDEDLLSRITPYAMVVT